jgi:hypothetical protein
MSTGEEMKEQRRGDVARQRYASFNALRTKLLEMSLFSRVPRKREVTLFFDDSGGVTAA